MNEFKKCEKCKENIPLEIKKCPNCKSLRSGTAGLIFVLLAIVFIIFISSTGNNKNRKQKSDVRIGEVSVYEEISQTTSCQELQKMFDSADSNGQRNRSNNKLELAKISTAYMHAIDEQMKKVGCYK